MKEIKLDDEEQSILDAYEADEFESVMTDERKKSIEQAAAAAFKKDKRINIRLSGRDLSAIQRRALEEGIPYKHWWQAFFTSMFLAVCTMSQLTKRGEILFKK